jgi:hypothetical protein
MAAVREKAAKARARDPTEKAAADARMEDRVREVEAVTHGAMGRNCRMDLPGPTTSVGTRTDYSVGPWDYPACATRHLKAWSTRTTQE